MANLMPAMLKSDWLTEILARLIMMLIFLLINQFMPVFKRIIAPDDWDELLNPHREDSVSELFLVIVIVCLPIASLLNSFYLNYQTLNKWHLEKNCKKISKRTGEEITISFYVDWVDAIFSYTLAIAVNGILTELVKKSVGRPRPDFFNRCFPQIDINDQQKIDEKIASLDQDFKCFFEEKKRTDLTPVFMNSYPTNDEGGVCDLSCITKGRRSFPSGHSSNAWVAFFFFSLYLWGKFKAFTPLKKHQAIRFIPGFVIMLIPVYIGISRTQDYRHHWEDVVVGSMMGIASAIFGYRQYYPSLSDTDANFSNRQLKWILINDSITGDQTELTTLKKRVTSKHKFLVKERSRVAGSTNEIEPSNFEDKV